MLAFVLTPVVANMGDPEIPPLAVQYSEMNPELNFAEVEALIDQQDAEGEAVRRLVVHCIYLRKSEEWKYEKEWRIVDVLGGRGLHEVRLDALSGVIFGCRPPQAEKESIKSQIERSGTRPTHYTKRSNASPSYSLEISPSSRQGFEHLRYFTKLVKERVHKHGRTSTRSAPIATIEYLNGRVCARVDDKIQMRLA